MANLRNNREYREAVLTALGMTEDRDVENEVNFKSALLEALGVEHTRSDVVNFETYREKLIEGVENYSGGGGESDFSTAEISISAAVPGVQCSVVSPHIITTPFDMLVADPKNYSNGDIVTVALYKGKASISASVVGMGNITVSGDIESMGGNYYLITGDCTITIS